MSTKLKGRDVAFYANGLFVAFSTSCALSVQCDTQEFTNALSGRGKRFRAGRYSWQMNCEQLMAYTGDDAASPTDLLSLLIQGEPFQVRMTAPLVGGPITRTLILSGNAVVQSWDVKAPLQGMATFSAAFTGDGDLDITTTTPSTPRPPQEWG